MMKISGLSFYTSSLLPIPHGMFTRYGGHSSAPFESLNVSYNSEDDDRNVQANRELIKKTLHIQSLCSVHQIHQDKIAVLSARDEASEQPGYDAIICSQPGTGLLIQQADCQAVLLFETKKKIVAAIHSGWRGSVQNIIGKTVVKMCTDFGADAKAILAVISPSLGPCCAEFIHYKKELPAWMHKFQVRRNHFDFWAISRYQLRQAGIIISNIDTTSICTCCSNDFFSYRRSVKKNMHATGRNGSVIALPA